MLPADYLIFYPIIKKYIRSINEKIHKRHISPNEFLDEFILGLINLFLKRYKIKNAKNIEQAIHKHCLVQLQVKSDLFTENPQKYFDILYNKNVYDIIIYSSNQKKKLNKGTIKIKFIPLHQELYNKETEYYFIFSGPNRIQISINLLHLFSNIEPFFMASMEIFQELKKFRPGSTSKHLETYREIIAMQEYLQNHSEVSILTSEASICKAYSIKPGTFNNWKIRNNDLYFRIRNGLNEKDYSKVTEKLKERKKL